MSRSHTLSTCGTYSIWSPILVSFLVPCASLPTNSHRGKMRFREIARSSSIALDQTKPRAPVWRSDSGVWGLPVYGHCSAVSQNGNALATRSKKQPSASVGIQLPLPFRPSDKSSKRFEQGGWDTEKLNPRLNIPQEHRLQVLHAYGLRVHPHRPLPRLRRRRPPRRHFLPPPTHPRSPNQRLQSATSLQNLPSGAPVYYSTSDLEVPDRVLSRP